MNIPPLDPSGAKGEHFHSLVDNTTQPRIFVINDNTRAYPGMLIGSNPRTCIRADLCLISTGYLFMCVHSC